MMCAADRLDAERACERLMRLYCHYVDHGQAARVAELFAEDGVWHSERRELMGQDAIAQAFVQRQHNTSRVSRHVCSSAVVNVEDEAHASGVVYLTLYRADGDGPHSTLPTLVGEYRDTFVKTPEGWRIRRREIVVVFGSTD